MTHQKKIIVWIVEDNENFSRPLQKMINHEEDLNCTQRFKNCELALQELSQPDVPQPHIFLLDLELPGMNGLEGIQQFKSLVPLCEVIILTVFDTREKVVPAILAGASGYVLKSSNTESICDSIRDVYMGGSSLTPQIARFVVNILQEHQDQQEGNLLSDRERNVLNLVSQGKVKKEIAAVLEISPHTVNNYIRRIYNKLQVNTLSAAVAKAIRKELI